MQEQTFTGESLAKFLKEDAASLSGTHLAGMVKPSEKEGHVSFSRSGCETWIDLPIEIIAQAQLLGQARCRDHVHPLFDITLKETQDPAARILAAVLAQSSLSPSHGRGGRQGQGQGGACSRGPMPPGMGAEPPMGASDPSGSPFDPALQRSRPPGASGTPGTPDSSGQPQTSALIGGGGFDIGGGGLYAWGCWDSCCESRCAAGHWVRNYALGRWQWVCDWWICVDPCEKCIWPW